jgi:hypothetical protein
MMSDNLAATLAAAVTKVTKDYAKIKKKEERDQLQDARLRERYFRDEAPAPPSKKQQQRPQMPT